MSDSPSMLTPLTVYGSRISYFTGKLENYLRLKGVDYRFQPLTFPKTGRLVEANTGTTQMPAVQLADGRWMTDSSAIIAWFESELPTPSIMPSDPVQRFFCLLLEDYADEWLWRPAMHYRWHYSVGARFGSTVLVDELTGDSMAPKWLKRLLITRRQRRGYTTGDGIGAQAVAGVEAIYHRTLQQLQAILEQRPFLLGNSPSLIDVGFSGPVFRHFALDPVPAEIMRQQAPAVYAWTARLWNAGPDSLQGEYLPGIPSDLGSILEEVGRHYLPYLSANIEAVRDGRKRFDADIADVPYQGARASRYRVWCLARLRDAFNQLDTADQAQARTTLELYGCWEPLWRDQNLPLDEQLFADLPFYGSVKMTDVN